VLSDGEGEGDVLPESDGDGDGDVVGEALDEEEADGEGDADDDADGEADPVGDVLAGADLAGAADLVGVGVGSPVGAGDLLRNSDSAGLMYAFAAGAAGRADDSGLGVTDTCDAEAGVVCDPPACDWVCGISDRGPAPVKAKTAAAEAATRPPVMQADASGRDKRRCACRATLPASG